MMRSLFALPAVLAMAAYSSAASVTSSFADGTVAPFTAVAAPSSVVELVGPAPTTPPEEENIE